MKNINTLLKNYYESKENEKNIIKQTIEERIFKVKEKQDKIPKEKLDKIEELSDIYFKNYQIEKPKKKYPINFLLQKNKHLKESIKSKEESKVNLLELDNDIKSKKYNETLMNKLKKDSNISKNKDLLIILRGYSKKKTFEFEEA